jgi:arylformamidase
VPARWQGWPPLVPHAAQPGTGEWVELSHPLRADLGRIPFFPAPRFTRIMSMPDDPLNLTEMQMVCHFGTHVDAPCHFVPDGPAFHEIPLERLYGPGVVWRIESEPYGVIDAETLAGATPTLRPGDIVLIDAGWASHFGTPRYDQNPSLSVAAAEWLVGRGVKLVGVDFATPDLAVDRRPPGFDWPVHQVLLGHGVLIAEQLTNLRPLAGHRIEAMFLALRIEGADGGPARVIARPAPD